LNIVISPWEYSFAMLIWPSMMS